MNVSDNPFDFALQYCMDEKECKNPLEIFMAIVEQPMVKMHGPEHHYIVAASLLTAYYNTTGDFEAKEQKLADALNKCKNILGGFCGFYGTCGASVATGIYFSLITGTTPKSGDEWKDCQLMTAKTLTDIAETGGPRCCKRVSYIAIADAIEYTKAKLNVQLETSEDIVCSFSGANPDCKQEKCRFNVNASRE